MENRKSNIAYYVTGHGLGHATRSVFSIQYLLNQAHYVHIITSITSSFFRENLSSSTSTTPSYSLHCRTLDSGAVQQGPLAINGLMTLEKYYQNIHLHYQELLMNEVKFLRENNIKVVITDATSIVCHAGKLAGCKVMILSNFTWDRMYSGMFDEIYETLDDESRIKYQEMILQCSNDYTFADLYLQLPGVVPTTPEIKKRVSGPLIGRNSLLSRQEILQQYSLDSIQFRHILLIGFGGHDGSWNILNDPSSLQLPDDWICLLLGGTESSSSASSATSPSSSSSASSPASRIFSIPYHCYVPDLISISSVVIGKLGYGFMSECLSHDVPMLYITRSCWPEEKYLREYMTNYHEEEEEEEEKEQEDQEEQQGDGNSKRIHCKEMKFDDFISGNWKEYLLACISGREEWNGDVELEAERIRRRQTQQLHRLDRIYQTMCSLEQEE